MRSFSTILFLCLFFAGSCLGATFTVTKVTDTNDGVCDADCSLREAISAANSSPSDDVIRFDAFFNTPQTVTVTGTGLSVTNAGTLVIDGPGQALLTISGNNEIRLFTVSAAPSNAGANLTLIGMTIANGFCDCPGGAVWNGQALTLRDSTIRNSRGFPGVIENVGTMSFIGATITTNTGVAVSNEDGNLTITNSLITNNTSSGLINDRGTITLNGSSVANNVATLGGAGIRNVEGTLHLINSSVTDNSSDGFNSDGGGILNFSASSTTFPAVLTLTNSTISRNSTSGQGSEGGGIMNGGSLTISSSTISDNRAATGPGGGIYNTGDTLSITNSTITGNTSALDGGGIYNRAVATLTNTTIVGNTADSDNNGTGSGGGVFNVFNNSLTSRNTIFADNVNNTAPECAGILTSQGYNLIENTAGTTVTGDATGNLIGKDPLLVALRNNGGPTLTIALHPLSPAVDAGDPNSFSPTDQRGVARPQDGDLNGTSLPDIGAYERNVQALTVTKTADTNDGACDADCSIREAMGVANASNAADKAIVFASGLFSTSQTITLTTGQLEIGSAGTLLILGPGRNLLTINGNDQSRIFFANGGATVAVRSLTATRGRAVANNGGAILNSTGFLALLDVAITNSRSSWGGAIKNEGGTLNIYDSIIRDNIAETSGGGISNSTAAQFFATLTIVNSTLQNNVAEHSGGGIDDSFGRVTLMGSTMTTNSVVGSGNSAGGIHAIGTSLRIVSSSLLSNTATGAGGAVRIQSGTLSLEDSNVTANRAPSGAGIYCTSAELSVRNSTFDANIASFRGGAILCSGGTLAVDRTTISNNSAADDGGGIANFGVMTIVNSTITANSAVDQGGGIFNFTQATLTNVTVSSNSAFAGGGVANEGSSFTTRNSIFGNNSATHYPDFQGTLTSQGYNLIENTSGTTINGVTTGNILGKDPRLAALKNNGGFTKTLALMPTSPAIDAADSNNFPQTDQRGIPRPQDGNLTLSFRPDIGAYERQVTTFQVTKTADTNDGSCDSDCSLREAVNAANLASTLDNVVTFAAPLFAVARTVTLGLGELELNNTIGTLFIRGTGTSLLTISGNDQSRVIFVNDPAVAAVQNLTISNGFNNIGLAPGGGVLNNGDLILDRVVIERSRAVEGAGIFNNGIGSLFIADSTIRHNTASYSGGGVYNSMGGIVNATDTTINENAATANGGGISNGGAMTLFNSTLSGNSTAQNGGGLANGTFLNSAILINVTITGNIAQQSGGGVFRSGEIQARNTIIANNQSLGANSGPDFDGSLFSLGYNLIGNTNRTTFAGDTIGNIVNVNALLDPILRENGGTTKTHALSIASPAIDKGSNTSPPTTTDQRGLMRPFDFASLPNASGGNGSDIGAFERQANDVAVQRPAFDLDGDGKSDFGIFRPSTGTWYVLKSQTGTAEQFQFGQNGDLPLDADLDGDFKADWAVWRPSTGEWFWRVSSNGAFGGALWGVNGDTPVPADYDGDGKTDFAVWRPTDGLNYIVKSTGGFLGIQWGTVGDVPSHADLNGDGKTDFVVFRPSNGTWYTLINGTNTTEQFQFGANGDIAVRGDIDGDQKGDIILWRPATGEWFFRRSSNGTLGGIPWGANGDRPVPGDYDGDGRTDFGVWRSTNGIHYIVRNAGGFIGVQWGAAGDIPALGSTLQ